MSTKFGVDFLNTVTSTNRKPKVVLSRRGRHLEKLIWRHIYALGAPIWMKFGRFMQNIMRITAIWSKSKPEVKFQYGGRLFFPNGSNYISRELNHVDQIWPADFEDNDVNKDKTGSSIEHVKNRYDVITPPQMARFGWNLADWCRITCQLRRCGRGGSRKKNFNMADVCFFTNRK